MVYIYKERIVRVEWTIFKGSSPVKENFSRALVKAFLIGAKEKYLIDVTAEDGTLKMELPQGLPEGSYDIEAIWTKNHDRPFDNYSISRTRKDDLFSITEYEEEATTVGDGAVVLKVRSSVATYGYDGLSAYEIAVLRGDFYGTEGEWLELIMKNGGTGGDGVFDVRISAHDTWVINGKDTGNPSRGEDGKDGEKGESTLSPLTVFVYQSSETKPNKPVGGYWDSKSNIVTYPSGWLASSDGLDAPIWMSNGSFDESGTLARDWSIPIRITGEDGQAGVDGVNMEFIYKLTQTANETPDNPIDNKVTGEVPSGWTDHPTGISSTYKVEWVSTRSMVDGSWGSWSAPAIWSKWGENGIDGDGVEYIYCLTNSSTAPIRPVAPDSGDESYPVGWTDDPSGVNSVFQWEWVSQRKKKNSVWGAYSTPALWAKYGETGHSGNSVLTRYTKTSGPTEKPTFDDDNINPGDEWSETVPSYSGNEAVWGIQATVNYLGELVSVWTGPYLVTGINAPTADYKTFFYKQDTALPDVPTFTDPDNPTDGWVDYPTAAETGKYWYQCVGDVDGPTNTITKWSAVVRITGSDGKDGNGRYGVFMFKVAEEGVTPTVDKTVRNPEEWSETPPAKSDTQVMWMITATITDDTFSGWSDPVRISGEKGDQGEKGDTGDKGESGSSYKVWYLLGDRSVTDSSANTLNLVYERIKDMADLNAGVRKDVAIAVAKLVYSVTEMTDEEIWSYLEANPIHKASVYLSDTVYTSLLEAIKDNSNLYIAATQAPITTGIYGEMKFDGVTEWPEFFVVSGIKGEDGKDGEKGEDGVGISSVINYYALSNSADTEPANWSTTVPTISQGMPYLWGYEETTMSDGSVHVTTKRILSIYAENGISITDVKNYYAVSSSDTDAPVDGWSETPQNMSADNRYLWNYEETILSNGTKKTTAKRLIGVYGDTGISVKARNTYYLATSKKNDVTVSDGGWTTAVPTMDSENCYLWTYEELEYSTDKTDVIGPVLIGSLGQNGVGISSVKHLYAVSSSSTTAPSDSDFSEDPQQMTADKPYLWSKVQNTYTDNTVVDAGAAQVIGTYSKDGVGIASITEYYLASSASSGITTSNSGWKTTVQETSKTARYLWNYEKITYTDNTVYLSTPCVIGMWSADGKGIKSITEYYLASAYVSGITTSTSGWSTSIPTVSDTKKYLWNYEVIEYTDGSTPYTSTPVIIGTKGEKGDKGDKGDTGSTGEAGPGLNYQGEWDSSKTYIWTTTAKGNVRPVVKGSDGKYYMINSAKKGASVYYKNPTTYYTTTDGDTSSNAYWVQFASSFESIATGLLFAEKATIADWDFYNDRIESLDGNVLLNGNKNAAIPLAIGSGASTSPSSAVFRVSSSGEVTCSKMNITGGYLGGWKITDTEITNRETGTISTPTAVTTGNSINIYKIINSSAINHLQLGASASDDQLLRFTVKSGSGIYGTITQSGGTGINLLASNSATGLLINATGTNNFAIDANGGIRLCPNSAPYSVPGLLGVYFINNMDSTPTYTHPCGGSLTLTSITRQGTGSWKVYYDNTIGTSATTKVTAYPVFIPVGVSLPVAQVCVTTIQSNYFNFSTYSTEDNSLKARDVTSGYILFFGKNGDTATKSQYD